MLRKGMTVLEATREWVREFNAIPQGMIEKLMRSDLDDWRELTLPSSGDSIYILDPPDGSTEHYGEISGYDSESDLYSIRLSDGKLISADENDFEVCRDDLLPMWGTMWSFGDSTDVWWLENEGGIRAMSDCGFRIYESEEFGCFFGIDGAGYDFYEAHWVPLYRARGLRWHDGTEVKEKCRHM